MTKSPAQVLSYLLRARDPGVVGIRYGLESPSVTRRFVTMARRGDRGRALAYIRNTLIPEELRRAEDKIRAGRASGLGKEVDKRIRRDAPGTGAIRLAREKARRSKFVRSDAHQEYILYTLDSASEARFLAPEVESQKVYVQLSPARDPGSRKVRPGRSPPKGGGATKIFDALLLPDVLERLSKAQLDGPVDIVIRGAKKVVTR